MINVEVVKNQPISVEIHQENALAVPSIRPETIIKGRDAYSPYVNDSGTWMCWSDPDQEWYDTGIIAKGPKGDTGPKG